MNKLIKYRGHLSLLPGAVSFRDFHCEASGLVVLDTRVLTLVFDPLNHAIAGSLISLGPAGRSLVAAFIRSFIGAIVRLWLRRGVRAGVGGIG